MGMTLEQIEAAIFESEQNDRRTEEAKNKPCREHVSGSGKYDNFHQGFVKIEFGIIDSDPKVTAYIWVNENLLVLNHYDLSADTMSLRELVHNDCHLYTYLYEKTFVGNVAILISRIGDQFKVPGLTSTEIAHK